MKAQAQRPPAQQQPQQQPRRSNLLARQTPEQLLSHDSPRAAKDGSPDGLEVSAAKGAGHAFGRIAVHSRVPLGLQAKRKTTTPGDTFESEADRVSEAVMSANELHPQPACACGGVCPKCSHADTAPKRLQAKGAPSASRFDTPSLRSAHEALRTPWQPLDVSARTFMEGRFGYGFGHVRVHTGREAAGVALAVRARAYTVGADIVFAHGEYSPGTAEGRHLLAHELAHVVQQSAETSSAPAPSPFSIHAGGAQLLAREQPKEVLHPLAEEDLVEKFAELYARLPEKVRNRLLKRDTVAMGIAVDTDGDPHLVYTVAGNRRYKALDQTAEELGIMRWDPRERATGRGAVGAPTDAEQLMIEGQDPEMKVVAIAASRIVCKDCGPAMEDEGIHVVEPQKFLTRLNSKVATSPAIIAKLGAAQAPHEHEVDEAAVGVAPKPGAPKVGVPPPGENEAVEAIDTPPIPKALPKAPPKPGTPPEEPELMGAPTGGQMAANAVGVGVMMIGQHYINAVWDEINKTRYEQYTQEAQPTIQAMIKGQEGALKKLTDEGQAAYANVTLKITYMSAPDIQTHISETHLTSVTVQSVVISSTEVPAKQEALKNDLVSRESVSYLLTDMTWTYVLLTYPVKLADALEEERRSAEDEIAFLDEVIDEMNAEGIEQDSEEMSGLLADREASLARQRQLEEKQSQIREKEEKRRRQLELDRQREEKRKQEQALLKYEGMKNKPEPAPSPAPLMPGPGFTHAPAAPEPGSVLMAPGAGEGKIPKADEMSRLFVAQKDQLVSAAERLRTSASAGRAATAEYAQSYREFVALRNPWPGQLRFTLNWLRQNVSEASNAIERLAQLDDWLKNGGWETLKQVPGPS